MLNEKEIGRRKLLSICTTSLDKIDKEAFDYIYSPHIEDYKNIHLLFFKEKFTYNVMVFNDTNMDIVEKKYFDGTGSLCHG